MLGPAWLSSSLIDNKWFMRAQDQVEIGDGQTFLIIVQGDRVIDYTWAMMPHIEFVKRSVGKLPDGAWVGTVSKIDGELGVISSKTFYGVQLPAPEWVTKTVRAAFK
jgi:hypothetical protein